MSIPIELLSSYELIHPEKTCFRLKPPQHNRKSLNSSTYHLNSTPQYQLYQTSWSKTYSKIQKIVNDLQSGLLLDLVTFIKTNRFNLKSSIRQPIPTAVILGASKILNASLAVKVDEIRNSEGKREYIPIQMSSQTCLTLSSSIKSIVNILEDQLNNLIYHDDENSHHDPDDDHTKTKGPNDQLARDDVDNIRALYAEFLNHYSAKSPLPASPIQATTESSIKSPPSSTIEGPKLIFLIDDFEGFDSCVLEDLITIISHLLAEKIPIILVISVNTSATAIHSLLPRLIVLKLRMTPFAVDMSGGTITSLMQRISLDPENDFDLSTGVMRSLMDGYDGLNKSIDALISKLKFIHLAYFHTNPLIQLFNTLTILDTEEDHKEAEAVWDEKLILLEGVTNKMEYIAHHLRLTNSWKNHSSRRAKKQSNIPSLGDDGNGCQEDDPEMIKMLIKSYKNRKMSRHLTSIALEILFAISHFWPEKERTHEWVLYNLFRPELIDYAIELCKLIKHTNDETVMNVLTSISELSNTRPECQWIEEILRKLADLIADHQTRKITGRSHLINIHEPTLHSTKIFQIDRTFSEILSDIYDSFMRFFRQNLGPDGLLELNEAWTFDDQLLLNQVFHPKYIREIKTGLELKSKDCSESSDKTGKKIGAVEEKEPINTNGTQIERIQIMFDLYMETNGKIINLNDWFGAYLQQLSNQNSYLQVNKNNKTNNNKNVEKKKSQHKNENENFENHLLKSFFLESLGDLAFLGIISPCNRKKEHVSKNFFG